ncbi:hypothetical protein M422DRAFT_25396 [Sphaerobolus stellatus SS14]|nr:hypothetical protein M422DRAFT_25396 [Sphaerobolus stellatus SS14]
MGFIQGQFIFGHIDEVSIQPISLGDSTPTSQISSQYLPKPVSADNYVASTINQSATDGILLTGDSVNSRVPVEEDTRLRKTHSLHLVDNKTRSVASLPKHSSTLGLRIQLMIYKRLLDNLFSLTTPFDFRRLWREKLLRPQKQFSPVFLKGLYSYLGEDDIPLNLNFFEERLTASIRLLNVNGVADGIASNDPVDSRLTLVYQLRSEENEREKGKGKGKKKKRAFDEFALSEDSDLQPVLACPQNLHTTTELGTSLIEKGISSEQPDVESKVAGVDPEQTLVENGPDLPKTEEDDTAESVSNTENKPETVIYSKRARRKARKKARREASKKTGMFQSKRARRKARKKARREASKKTAVEIGEILGQIEFKHDDSILEDHVRNILQWWYGHREAAGPTGYDAARCRTCEYANGCEWREAHAEDNQQSSRQKTTQQA